MIYRRLILSFVLLILGGCASQVPVLIEFPPDPDPKFHQVKNNTAAFQNEYIRWGGKIISIENRESSTWIEILANPLNSYGRPGSNDDYQGRFIAKIDGFLDSEHYGKNRSLTVYGTVESNYTKRIDDHPYNYPLVNAKVYYLWPEYRTARYHYPYYPRYYYHSYYRHQFGFHHHPPRC